MRLAAIIRENLTELALIDTLDMGKPISEAVSVDVPGSATFFQWHAEAIDKLYDEVAPTGGRDVAMIRRVPLGVIGAVSQSIRIWQSQPAWCLAWFTSNRCAKLKALCAASSSSWGFCVPDFSTFSRQGSRLVLPMKPRADRDGPIHLVVDSTGLKIFSEGEWLQNKHKTTAKRKSWRKLHLGLDLATGEIVCSDLTTEDVGDPLHW